MNGARAAALLGAGRAPDQDRRAGASIGPDRGKHLPHAGGTPLKPAQRRIAVFVLLRRGIMQGNGAIMQAELAKRFYEYLIRATTHLRRGGLKTGTIGDQHDATIGMQRATLGA